MRRNYPHVMILSTQTPVGSTKDFGVQAGKSGQFIQEVTKGGFVKMHRDCKIHQDKGVDEQAIFSSHLHKDGWLVITGHGSPGAGDTRGFYKTSDDLAQEMDIECKASDFASLVMDSNTLKSGDRINILLLVCYAARSGIDYALGQYKPSFAEELGMQFAARGIKTCIVANMKAVGRIGEYSANDIPQQKLLFRADKNDIRIFYNDAKDNRKAFVFAPYDDVYMTEHGIGIGAALLTPMRLMDAEILRVVREADLEIDPDLLPKQLFESGPTQEVERKIREEGGVVVRRSATQANALSVTYFSTKVSDARHCRFECIQNKGGVLQLEKGSKVFKDFVTAKKNCVPPAKEAAAAPPHPSPMWKSPDKKPKTDVPQGVRKSPQRK